MRGTKLFKTGFKVRQLKPAPNLTIDGVSAKGIETAEYLVRNALPGNEYAINLFFETVAEQRHRGQYCCGPFLLLGNPSVVRTFTEALTLASENREADYYCDLKQYTESHTGAAILGSPTGYVGCSETPPLVRVLRAAARRLNSPINDEAAHHWPIALLEDIDQAHRNPLSSLQGFLTDGVFTDLNQQKWALRNGVILATATAGLARFPLLPRSGPELQVKLRELLEVYPPESPFAKIAQSATLLPFFEPTPAELLELLSVKIGKRIAMACKVGMRQANRCRLDPELLHRLWFDTPIIPLDDFGKILQKVYDRSRGLGQELQRRGLPNVLHHPPKPGHTYLVGYEPGSNTQLRVRQVPIGSMTEQFQWTLPLGYLERTMGEKYVLRSDYWNIPSNFEACMNARVVGQSNLIAGLTERLKARIQLQNHQPLFMALLNGPTGTGKTELGLQLAEVSFHPALVCRCAELSEEALYEKLFGSQPDSVVNALRRHPASVVIFDEVDKGPRKFWDYLLAIADTGRLEDNEGKHSVSLRHAILLLTANYLGDELGGLGLQAQEKSLSEMDALLRDALKRNIPEPSLERLNLVSLMLPIEGEATYPMWDKFVREKLKELGISSEQPDSKVFAYLEYRHQDKGGAPGARARKTTLDELFSGLPENKCQAFYLDYFLRLTKAAESQWLQNPRPRSERQRCWEVTQARSAKLRELFPNQEGLLTSVLEWLGAEGSKVQYQNPVGVMLLAGPTGTGKTYLGECIAEAFGKNQPIVLGCGQLNTEEAVRAALFGAPVGFRDSDKGGQLTNPVLRRRDQVVILDEFDRAHDSLLNCLMQVLDKGFASIAGENREADLRQCLFILTTNLAAAELTNKMEELKHCPIEEQSAAARQLIAATGRLEPAQLARIKRVFALTKSIFEAKEVRTAIQKVFQQFGREQVQVADSVVEHLVKLCSDNKLRDLRSLMNLVEAKLWPTLKTGGDSTYQLKAGVIELA